MKGFEIWLEERGFRVEGIQVLGISIVLWGLRSPGRNLTQVP